MGNSTSEQSVAETKPSVYFTKEEQASLLAMYSNISSNPESQLLAAFDAQGREEFRTILPNFYETHMQSYEQFEEFVIKCTRSPPNKIISTFWELAGGNTVARMDSERLANLTHLILELSLTIDDLAETTQGGTAARIVDFLTTHFATLGVSGTSTDGAVGSALVSTLNNYLPCTPKALETFISHICFQGMHSPSYKPFIAPTLDFPSEILGRKDLLPLALHSESLQGAWKRLYSTSADGLSFNRIVYHSLGYNGPTCVLIRCADAAGTVLGMLAYDHWKESNRFYGSSKNALFVLAPKLRIYRSKSGGNGSYQWLNSKSLTQPRGMGFGGTLDGFRIFVPESLEGCRAANSCPTYEPGKLIEGETFEIQTMEIWGCGGAEVISAALAAQAQNRAVADETIRRARQVDKAQFFNNEFDKEFLLSNTTSHASRDRTGNS